MTEGLFRPVITTPYRKNEEFPTDSGIDYHNTL